MSAPRYRVLLFKFADPTGGTDFGVGDLLAEIENARNVGWSTYLNDVPEAFFTVYQDDPKLLALRGYEGKCHVRIYRDADLVWTGWGMLELDASDKDVVVYCYGYLAGMYWTLTDWNVRYQSAQINTIVSDLWTRAKTTLDHSTLGFVATGTIEAPVTTSGGATAIVLPSYQMFYKRGLYVLREMAAISMSDTTNTVVFEITNSTTPTFNFWKNRGTDMSASVKWELGGPYVKGFREYRMPVYHRNQVYAVGTAPNNPSLRKTGTDATDMDTWGRREDALYMSWVRDATELERASAFRSARSLRTTTDLELRFYANKVLPPGATGCTWKPSDLVHVVIDKGVTNVDSSLLVSGAQVIWTGGNEHVNALVQQRAGT